MEERRNLDAVATLLKVEEKLADIYVEGYEDKVVLSWFLKVCFKGKDYPAVKSIDEISIPYEDFLGKGYPDNNKHRVIHAANYLLDKVDGPARALGVIDVDRDNIRGCLITSPALINTHYTSLEMYLLSEDRLQQMFDLTFSSLRLKASAVLKSIYPAASEEFLFSAAKESIGLNYEDVSVLPYVDFRAIPVAFNATRYQQAVKTKTSLPDWEKLSDEVSKLRPRLTGQMHFDANGHVAMSLLSRLIMSFCKKQFEKDTAKEWPLTKILLNSFHAESLRSEPLFLNVYSLVT